MRVMGQMQEMLMKYEERFDVSASRRKSGRESQSRRQTMRERGLRWQSVFWMKRVRKISSSSGKKGDFIREHVWCAVIGRQHLDRRQMNAHAMNGIVFEPMVC